MEETVIVWMDLGEGEPYAFLPECNVLGLPKRIRDCPDAIERTVTGFQGDWRRSMLRVVS